MMVNAPSISKPLVLHVRCVTGTGGGPEKTILNSPRFLNQLGYRSICAYLHPPNDDGFSELRRRAESAEAPLVSVPDRGPFDLRAVRQLIRLCRTEQVAVWHGHDYKSNLIGLLARQFWPMKTVTTVHGWGVSPTRRTPLYHCIDRLCLPHYDDVLCVSPDLYEQCIGCGVPRIRCHLVKNGITTDSLHRTQSREQARSYFRQPARPKVVGAMGRLSAEKGFDLLIEAAVQLLDAGSDFHLWIAGDGPERANLESQIASCRFQDRIHLLGHVNEPRVFFEALDVFALSSLREGLPNVLLEAMALGLPVLATRVAGIPSLIQHNVNGLLVAPASVSELTAGLHRLLDDSQEPQMLGEAAQRTIKNSFSFERRMQAVAQIYDRLMVRGSTRVAPARGPA